MKRMIKKCSFCGEYFDTTKTGRYKYCSEKCAKSRNNNKQHHHLIALDSLSLNVPRQVELVGDGYSDGKMVYEWGKCPKCGWEFEDGDKDWEEPYCCHCGQKLHWFDNAEEDEELDFIQPHKKMQINLVANSDAISRESVLNILDKSMLGTWVISLIEEKIKQLPSVSCSEKQNRCGDAVSRELVKKDIARWIGYIDEDMIARMHITIDKLPSVSTEKIGHWIEDENEMLVLCSNCGEEHEECSKYCPSCGCFMKGDNNERS